MADVQIAIIDQENTQIALAAPSETSVNIAVPGIQGVPGPGVPTGGTANQVLFKQSGTNYDTAWSTVTSAMIGDLQIADADVSTTAAIAGTKIAPNFGSQTVQTTGVFSHALGTAAAPTVTFTGDLNTGIYSPGADQLAISTGGTGRVFVDASGNVGVATTLPDALFHAKGTTKIGEGAASNQTKLMVNTLSGTAAGIQLFQDAIESWIIQNPGSSTALTFGNSGTERLRITSDGKVGIGTSSPSHILHISGINATTSTVKVSTTATSDATIQTATSLGTFAFGTGIGSATKCWNVYDIDNAVERLRITSDGNVGIGTSSPGGKLTLSYTSTFANPLLDGNAGLALVGSSTVRTLFGSDPSSPYGAYIQASNTGAAFPLLLNPSGGNVGIGTSSPSELLHINNASGAARIRVQASGTNNAVLQLSQTTGLAQFGTNPTNVYITDSAARDFTVDTNNTERLRITSDGKVGIGTSAPAVPLHVVHTGGTQATFERTGANGSFIGLKDNSGSFSYIGTTNGTFSIQTAGSSYSDKLVVTSDGKVGIGTSSPGTYGAQLAVVGGGIHVDRLLSGGAAQVLISMGASNGANFGQIGNTGTRWSLGYGTTANTIGTEVLVWNSSGNVGIGLNAPQGLLDLGAADSATALAIAGWRAASYNGSILQWGGITASQWSTAAFFTGGTERARIDSSGRLLVGTTSDPGGIDSRLAVSNATDTRFMINTTGLASTTEIHFRNTNANGEARITNNTGGPLTFYKNLSTEVARLDSSGRLLVGTSTTSNLAGLSGLTQLEGSSASTPGFIAWNNSNTAGYGSYLALGRSRGSTVGSNTAVQNNDDLGRIYFFGANGTDRSNWAAEILCSVDGDPFTAGDTTDLPGRLVFLTTPDGSSGAAERMRLNSQGELLIGTTTRTANGGVLQISNGITFPGTQSACSDPNTLDDYEEGTFAPTVVGTTAAGVGTYSAQVGRYTKVGNRVFYNITLAWTAHTGTGDMRIGGLPFAANPTVASNVAASFTYDGLTYPASASPMVLSDPGSTHLLLFSSTSGGAMAALAIDTNATIYVAGHYEV